jgi:energy-coupling factor transporter ATP-binding protein EcfA2
MSVRITRIRGTKVFSFVDLDLEVPPELSVVVGPNGSGKSNLARLVRLVLAAVRSASASSRPTELETTWSLAGWYESRDFEVRVGLVFDEEAERSLIQDWARAAMITQLAGSTSDLGPRCDACLPPDVGGADLLADGELVVRHDSAQTNPWVVYWETRNPVAHLDLWRGEGLSLGPVPDDARWIGGRSDLWRIAVGDQQKQVPPTSGLAEAAFKEQYGSALATLTLPAVVGALQQPLDLVARRSGADREVPALARLMSRLPARPQVRREQVTFADVLNYLLSDSLTVTENRRSMPTTMVELQALAEPACLEDGSGAAVRLSRMKNGDADERERFRAVQEIFEEVTSRRLDVRQEAVLQADGPSQLAVTPVVVDVHPDDGHEVDIPLHLAGEGLGEMALLALLLADPTRVLILDEPATNLSPTAQRRLLIALRQRRGGRQTLLMTHSAHLVPVQEAADLRLVTRVDRADGRTTVHRPSVEGRAFDELRNLLRLSHLREPLFAAGVVLVEGSADVVALETWLAGADEYGLVTPDSAHVIFIEVGGHEEFTKYAHLMTQLGVQYAIVADGPAFEAPKILSKLPNSAPPAATDHEETFEEARSRWANYRVHTLADQFGTSGDKGGEIEAYFARVNPEVWAELNAAPGPKPKPLMAHRFSLQVPLPGEVIELWKRILVDLGLA